MINDILSRATEGQPVPEVGMGATILMVSDRHAATIVEVFGIGKATAVNVRRDIATVVSGKLARWRRIDTASGRGRASLGLATIGDNVPS